MIFYFSGTGNSEHVAKRLSALLGDDRLVSIGDAVRSDEYDYQLAADERIGWVIPVYSWGPAPIATLFAKYLRLEGCTCHTYCYTVLTCGDEVGEAPAIWRKALGKIGCQAIFSIQMPNNYILLPGFDVDSHSLECEKRGNAEPRIAEIALRVKQKYAADEVVAGSWRKLKSRLVYPLFRRYAMSDKHFYAKKDVCTSCGLCSKVCSVGNVTMTEDGTPRWHKHCAMCLGCIHRCPVRAIEYGNATQKKGRYHF